jgi:hypothetical protein
MSWFVVKYEEAFTTIMVSAPELKKPLNFMRRGS